MLSIPCPWCGLRDEREFHYGGEAHMQRPPMACNEEEWSNYLFMRSNTKGQHKERWNHALGCRRWFNALRDTTTNRVIAVYKPDAAIPETTE